MRLVRSPASGSGGVWRSLERRLGAWWGGVQQRSLRGYPQYTELGITVYGDAPRPVLEKAFPVTSNALRLIDAHAPRIRSQLERDLFAILVREAPIAYYLPSGRICVLPLKATRLPAAWVAATIVHEAMHKRCLRGRLRNRPGERRRVEEICVARELRFLRMLPNEPQHHIDQYVAWREASFQREWWGRRYRLRLMLAALTGRAEGRRQARGA